MPGRIGWISGLTLAALVALLGCGQGEKKEGPPEAPAPAPAEPAAPVPFATGELRRTEPDPEVVGVESTLPDDVPLPPAATPVHPPLRASGTTRATFEVAQAVSALQGFYKEKLAASGWKIEAEKSLEAQGLISARKDGRELSVAMSETDGRTQFVLLVVGD